MIQVEYKIEALASGSFAIRRYTTMTNGEVSVEDLGEFGSYVAAFPIQKMLQDALHLGINIGKVDALKRFGGLVESG